jgi:hypothetical protein
MRVKGIFVRRTVETVFVVFFGPFKRMPKSTSKTPAADDTHIAFYYIISEVDTMSLNNLVSRNQYGEYILLFSISIFLICGFLVSVTRWYRTKRPMQLPPPLDLLGSPSESQSFSFSPPDFSALVAADTPKRRETGREGSAELCLSVSLSYLKGYLPCRKILRLGAVGFTSPRR